MEEIMRKKADYEQLLRAVFSCFGGQKKIFFFFLKHCSVRTEKLHKISFIYICASWDKQHRVY
jgi:hypothetical protein